MGILGFDFSNLDLLNKIEALFKEDDNSTRYNAATALGGICIGNTEYFLPIVLKKINE